MTHPSSEPGAGLSLQPMVHVERMDAAVAFYEALGATVAHGSRDGDFVMMQIGSSRLGLLAHPPNPEQNEGLVELNFDTGEPLDVVERRLRDAGVTIVQPVTDQGFGRQLQISTPDGLLVKVNELDEELYT
ncbi:MAG: VOC family protein [Actinomycetota bacterium]|nr:VOC family protein [Actinomycetota bacterium]